MDERGRSDSPVVPAKPSNKAALAVAEVVEGRGLAKENTTNKRAPDTESDQVRQVRWLVYVK